MFDPPEPSVSLRHTQLQDRWAGGSGGGRRYLNRVITPVALAGDDARSFDISLRLSDRDGENLRERLLQAQSACATVTLCYRRSRGWLLRQDYLSDLSQEFKFGLESS